ncbi:BrnA antitoxin family protein [Allokutzneria sp. A3M-2-11 16]|uniref:BrnA antitoxin family protein n=1 Tax=Allokutzneria sp. A3M-2-11 16 TaxID=2962043 RepID=UPI0020B8ADCF|nr:BrnA antitoxin family protein [Allokutzneria sp. A3M-2-11 16]MCP3798502.1 BrnA antitoxin family protein [Allokutzneria sp. A3M-2-11 16]
MKNRLEEIAEYADSHDFSADMEHGTWHPGGERDPDPMVSTSLRLPKSLLDWVRGEAEKSHVKHTALIRSWIEEKRTGSEDLAQRVKRLENAVFRHSA